MLRIMLMKLLRNILKNLGSSLRHTKSCGLQDKEFIQFSLDSGELF